MKDYLILKEDEKQFHVKHPKGHTFQVAKKSLSKDLIAQMSVIPRYAHGGEVSDQQDSLDSLDLNPPDNNPSDEQKIVSDENNSENGVIPISETPSPSVGVLSQAPQSTEQLLTPEGLPNTTPQENQPALTQQPTPSNEAQAPATPQVGQQMLDALNQQKQGVEQAGVARSQEADRNAKAYEDFQKQITTAQSHYQESQNQLLKQRQNLLSDINQGHLNPDRVWQNMSTGNKILAGVSILISGLGGQGNGAMQVINQAINHDMESQKQDLNKKQTLLSQNMAQYHDLQTAQAATRLDMNTILTAKIAQSAASSNSKVAMANAQVAIGQLNSQSAMLQDQIAKSQAAQKMMSDPNLDPALKVRFGVPESKQKEVFKELETAQNMAKARDNVLEGYDQIAKINTVGNRTFSPIQSKREIEAIRGTIIPALSKASAGRFTREDAAYIEKIFSEPGNTESTVKKNKEHLLKFINEKMNFPQLKAYNINPNPNSLYQPDGSSVITQGKPKGI